jgi:dihydropteroate synthase
VTGGGGLPRTQVMGILNATPDSFSDGGLHLRLDAALSRAEVMIDQGADLLDVGGESTRPGAAPVSEAEELDRVIPLITALSARFDTPLSVDTRKASVARAAMAAGATMWNDVTALGGDHDSLAAAAAMGCQVVLMHMRGEPATMQQAPEYENVVAEVTTWLVDRAELAMTAGVRREAIWLDPGIGFGKSPDHNYALLAALRGLAGLGYPVLLGASRKGVIRAADPSATTASDRIGGSLAIALHAAAAGCQMIRVHDVRETVQALEVAARIESAKVA